MMTPSFEVLENKAPNFYCVRFNTGGDRYVKYTVFNIHGVRARSQLVNSKVVERPRFWWPYYYRKRRVTFM